MYVRFLPYGKQGVHELKTYDSSLALFKHPMDYNEIRKPVVYVDKTLPELFLTQPLEEDDEDNQKDSRFIKAKKSNKANKEEYKDIYL